MHDRYVDLVAQITAWTAAEPDIQGLVVIGSQSRIDPPPDRWSDLDLMVFANTPDRWLEAGRSSANPSDVPVADWLEQFGRPLAAFTEITPLGGHDWAWSVRRVLYADGRDVDFSILPAGRADEAIALNTGILAWGYRVLYDPRHSLAPALERTVASVTAGTWGAGAPESIADAALQEAVQVLLYHVIWALKKLRRGEVWVGAGCLNAFLRPYLLTLIEAYGQATGAPRGTLTYEGRFLETRTSPEVLALLRLCAMPYDAAAGIAALGALLDLIEALAPAVYGSRGLAWDRRAFEALRALYEEMAGAD
jgi:aminoglycoside 6-adenylyltransferase